MTIQDNTLHDQPQDHRSYMLALPVPSSPSMSSSIPSSSKSCSSAHPLSEDESIVNAVTHSNNSTHRGGHLYRPRSHVIHSEETNTTPPDLRREVPVPLSRSDPHSPGPCSTADTSHFVVSSSSSLIDLPSSQRDGDRAGKGSVRQRSSRSKEQAPPPNMPSRRKRQLDEEYLPPLDLDAKNPDAKPKAKKQRYAGESKARKPRAKNVTVPEGPK